MIATSQIIRFFISVVLVFLIAGCSTAERSPVQPDIPENNLSATVGTYKSSSAHSTHHLWGWFQIAIDPEKRTSDIIPVRSTAGHWNVLSWLEQAPCNNCLGITNITPSGTGTIYVTIQIKHPFASKNLTGFDVRGIAIFNANHEFPASGLTMSDRTLGDGEVVNPDGYTTLYNSATVGSGPNGLQGYFKGKLATVTAPNSLINAYRRFRSPDISNTRNAFYAGEAVTTQYEIDMPNGPFVFGYAVDASWAKPTHKPVTDPMIDFGPEANCPEVWQMVVYQHPVGGGLSEYGGSIELEVLVYDWQGTDNAHPMKVECPELFDGEIEGNWVEKIDDHDIYSAIITNTKLPPAGTYRCLISKEAAENDPLKPWLDLTAYQVTSLEVKGTFVEITPPQLNFSPNDIAVSGNYAFVAAAVNGLHYFDITDPANPVWKGYVPISSGNAMKVEIADGYAYVADYLNGLKIIDIDPIGQIHIAKEVNYFGNTPDLAVGNGYAYMAAWDQGVKIIDIDPVGTASVVKEISTPGWVFGITFDNGYAYAGARDVGLLIIDVDPVNTASVVKTVDTPGSAGKVAVSNGYAFVCDEWTGLQVIDVDPPASASIVKTVGTVSATGISISGDWAYVGGGISGLHVLDINPPDLTSVVTTLDLDGFSTDSDSTGNYCYIASQSGGIKVVDINPPDLANLVNTVWTPGWVHSAAVSGGYAFLANDWSGFQTIDVDPVATACVVDNVELHDSYAIRVVVSGSYAYISSGWAGLKIFDISSPGSSSLLTTVDTPVFAYDANIFGDYAFVADYESGLQIIDINPPGSASIVNAVDTTGWATAVVTDGEYAYIADYYDGLQIIDINPVGSASVVKTVDTLTAAVDVTIAGGYAFVADDISGIQIIDIDPVSSASIVNTVSVTGGASGVAVHGDYLYVAALWAGLQIIDINPVDEASVIATIPLTGNAERVTVSGNFAYVSCDQGGLRIVKLF